MSETPAHTPTHTPTPPSIFFSYSRADSSIVERLRTDLGAQGITTWVDREGIRPGTPDWEESLRTAIRAAAAVLLVASPNARSSRYVKDELRIAQMYHRPIYPVWVTGTQWMEVIPLGLGGMQFIDAREERYASALSEIVFTLTGDPFAPVPDTIATPHGGSEPNIEPRNPYKGLRPFTSDPGTPGSAQGVADQKYTGSTERTVAGGGWDKWVRKIKCGHGWPASLPSNWWDSRQ